MHVCDSQNARDGCTQACVNLATGNYTATAVRLLRRASECVEYGAVNMLKAHFGFIKCCSRTLDAFFHFSSLKEASARCRPLSAMQHA